MSSEAKCKKLITSVERCVDDCIAGLVRTHTGLRQLEGHRVIVRADVDDVKQAGKVAVVCGGGSGHEPAHAGYIGQGMLTAAVAGAVFASPPPRSILAAIRLVGKDNPAGVLVVVKNYTGDRLNFGLAVERAKAEGMKIDMVVVAEDCALTSTDKTAGRRGLCGTVLVHKIAGALAEKGCTLEEIVKIVKEATTKMGTVGLSLTPCSLPGSGPSFQLASDEMELGLGIHGEAGIKRMKLQSARDSVCTVIDHMTNPQTTTHLELSAGDSVAVMVNNLGGTSVLEMNIVANEAIAYLEQSVGVVVDRAYCGTFMTSLEMAGISITVLRLDSTLKTCLDAPTNAPAWQRPLLAVGAKDRCTPSMMKVKDDCAKSNTETTSADAAVISQAEADRLLQILQAVAEKLICSEKHLNTLDKQSGDGDCGSTIARGAREIQKQLGQSDKTGLHPTCPSRLAVALAHIAENTMGGSSGGLYSLFLTAAAAPLQFGTDGQCWAQALQSGIEAIMRYGAAKPGQRTMLDPLCSASTVFSREVSKSSAVNAFAMAVQAAEESAQETAKMKAQAGRASYVSPDLLTKADPGAVAVAIWMRTILDKLQ